MERSPNFPSVADALAYDLKRRGAMKVLIGLLSLCLALVACGEGTDVIFEESSGSRSGEAAKRLPSPSAPKRTTACSRR